MKTANKTKGKEGEQLALEFLRDKGFKLLEQNFLVWGGEIDLIMLDKEEYVFVEVKTRFSDEIPLEELISSKKLKTIERTAELWLRKNGLYNVDWRIDFIGVNLSKKYVHWIKDCVL